MSGNNKKSKLFKRYPLTNKLLPARPRNFWIKASNLALTQVESTKYIGLPNAANPAYINWLKRESMLGDADRLAHNYSAKGSMWQNPFAKPRPKKAIDHGSVWYTAYPVSMITKKDQSVIATLADPGLWRAFEQIGIRAIHTGPMKRAGGVDGWRQTPSTDGHFDRISTKIDPMFGTNKEFQRLCRAAEQAKGIVIDDIVPGHTGRGADFLLATMKYRDYPGIYHMVEIDPADWHVLPEVAAGKRSANISPEQEEELKKRGYIIGKLQRVIFYEPGVKETNWSVTKTIRGIDGVKRRWVYLHYFKEGQPSINWLDPTFTGMKLVIGDALNSIGYLGARGVRLDANGFLGLEKTDDDTPAWSEGHPMSEAANQIISGMVRKIGGFTFQELNLAVDDIKNLSNNGADLSYDFINRPAYHHALATGDSEFLRLMLKISLEIGVQPMSLVHALQNHDELTHELVHFWTLHKDDKYDYHGQEMTGLQLRKVVIDEIRSKLLGDDITYNLAFTENGIACTTASAIAAILGYHDLDKLSQDQVAKIRQLHLLLAIFNAWQPGVFAISGWDLVGALTIDPEDIKDLLGDGDTRWINRGAYDLMDVDPAAERSFANMPKAPSLYGNLPTQLKADDSFARQIQRIIAVRDKYGIAYAEQVDIPDVS
ncbi:MAG TPA: maltose alpha-D-glucosyltransferase, partial [Candidatus Saccharimonadales bacterium]|nr:maltose alpha-D-glucosyltransferase [Candidatus Saccharimonadales bacterium]